MKRKYQYLIDLILVLTHKDLKVRYKNSVLGYFWSIANPLAFAIVFFVAFKIIMKIDMENYALFLIMGLFPWQWISNSLGLAPSIFLSNASLVKKVDFPRNVLPLTIVLQDMLHYILSIPVIVLFMMFENKSCHFSWLYGIPLLLVIQLVFVYGITLMLSSINLFFRDLERIVTIALVFSFYFTPIIYPVAMIPAKYQYLIHFNPFAHLVISWRSLFMDGQLNGFYCLTSFGYSILALVVGLLVYKKLSGKFAEVV